MKKQHVTGIVAFSLCLSAVALQAQLYYLPEGAGPYFRAGIGPSFWEDGRLNNFDGPVNYAVEYRTGLSVETAVGYAFNQYIAMDFEVGFIGAEIKDVQAPNFVSDNSHLYEVPFLANAILSYPIPHSNVVPYVGVGAGGAGVTFDTDNFGDNSGAVFGAEDDVVFAWQALAGVHFRLNQTMSLGVGYRYFATGAPSFSYPPSPNFPVSFDGIRSHSVLFMFQMSFW